MFRILEMIGGNLASGPVSHRFPDTEPTPEGFRGQVVLDPARCVACHTCAYVCVSNAVTGQDEGSAYAWQYNPGRCTFCARCVDHCPVSALSMESVPLPAYDRQGDLNVSIPVPLPACPECGVLVRPVVRELLDRALEHATEENHQLAALCERCRRLHYQRNFYVARDGSGHEVKP